MFNSVYGAGQYVQLRISLEERFATADMITITMTDNQQFRMLELLMIEKWNYHRFTSVKSFAKFVACIIYQRMILRLDDSRQTLPNVQLRQPKVTGCW